MKLSSTYRRHFTVFAINRIDDLLASCVLNRIYEMVCVYIPFVFFFSPTVNYFIKKVSRLVVPKDLSIAIIMDGNRRYARYAGISRKQGHILGYSHMHAVLEYMDIINCKAAGFFAFGKKNYNRSTEEISDIMEILENAFKDLDDRNKHKNLLGKVSIVGDLDSMPKHIQPHVQKLNRTGTDKKSCFIFMSYSSLDEYVNDGTDGHTPEFDIIIRPGGEKRLSDFLLCNSSKNTMLAFLSTKWPLLTPVHILLVIIKYTLELSLDSTCQ
ncbi:ditrans,polycis-polyprenyl diphosphate synthase [Nematocida ausubeli]|nr:ditrans,polycis-polyprenyl diphosphate synthase [Nematocida ausubeli]